MLSSIMSWSPIVALMIFSGALAEKCTNLAGNWYNELGSEMALIHNSDGKLYGIYQTAVERENGSAGAIPSFLFGFCPYNSFSATFAFTVVWQKGSSTTTWTGQCLVRDDGKETLLTSWLLRSQVNTCIDKWKSTMIGRDVFTRYEQRPGKPKPSGSPPTVPPTTIMHDKPRQPCDIVGHWINELNSTMIIEQDEQGIIAGKYYTAVEAGKGDAGGKFSKLYGLGGQVNGTFGFLVVWKKGESVTGWVAQCQICEKKTEVINSAWVLRSKIPNLSRNWISTHYGEDTFTRQEQKEGPSKRQEREDL